METGSEAQRRRLELRAAIEAGPTLLLDGALGTELERRGIDSTLPLWSARALLDAPEVVAEIHAQYVQAGARLITANTFRTQRRTLAAAGLADRDFELSALAVGLAREAAEAAAHSVWVAASAAPLEDCYHPERVPDDDTLQREHGRHARGLALADADVILVETMNTGREARAAARAAREAGLPCLVSFVCWEPGRLLSGEPLREAIDSLREFEPLTVGVNCLPPSAVDFALDELRSRDEAFGVYANLGGPLAGSSGLRSEDLRPAEFAEHALRWQRAGARLVGGCCGTTPEHIRAIANELRSD